MSIRLHQTENTCCTSENFTPIFVYVQENGRYQVGLTQFCKKCGWINTKAFYLNKDNTDKDGVMSQDMFTKMTDKVKYVCFPDKYPDPALAELSGLELLLFKTQRLKKIKPEMHDKI